jgi:hypothetical protein
MKSEKWIENCINLSTIVSTGQALALLLFSVPRKVESCNQIRDNQISSIFNHISYLIF